ncbi:DUF445 domain-containing protein [Leifsonia sp. F6_8S_P_1B]|uniref:DUF445 domain-containing protein n=1 Tax=Leifsonia williamsii TaxID=3035919 RepID=A0ABT8KHX9_9MICO|nr:DUF445 domain-containing protein [Leifsonia williamsii]MDN4615929.1 DUF445 domain-containing protein [Leifsonia williamsii]
MTETATAGARDAALRDAERRDAERRLALRRMKTLATALLILAAVVFTVSFALEDRYPWLGYVRAAAEGAMVGALADWFAVTALFRHPLGLRIPHTAIIPTRKDEIGAALGEFVETNFLSDEVVARKLGSMDLAGAGASWLAEPASARRVVAEASRGLTGLAALLDDERMRDAVEAVVRTHLVAPLWGPPLGRLGERVLDSGGHLEAVDLLLDRLDEWLAANPEAFASVVSRRLPSWMPSFVDRLVDERLHSEARRFVRDVRDDPEHRLRRSLDEYLAQLADRLQHDEATIERLEAAKARAFDDPRIRDLAASAWTAARTAAVEALNDEEGELRRRAEAFVGDAARRVLADEELRASLNARLTGAALHLVTSYRGDIAHVITETVQGWDPAETTDKIETQVGRDLQFIRINGTVVGALAGLAIYAVATGVAALF